MFRNEVCETPDVVSPRTVRVLQEGAKTVIASDVLSVLVPAVGVDIVDVRYQDAGFVSAAFSANKAASAIDPQRTCGACAHSQGRRQEDHEGSVEAIHLRRSIHDRI